MTKRIINITRRNKIGLPLSALMVLAGYFMENSFLMMVGLGLQLFIWVDIFSGKMSSEPK